MTTEYDFDFGFTPSYSGFANMEIDRIFAELEPPRFPLIRLYTWKRATISYGVNQNPVKRLRIEKCLNDGIEVVARPTGGREILHGWDLCCSVIQSTDREKSDIGYSDYFDKFNDILKRGLILMGFQDIEYHSVTPKKGVKDGPCFSQIDRGEISVSGKKAIASAQRIYEKSILQQSSISVKKPSFDIMDYLRVRDDNQVRHEIVNSVAYLEEVSSETFSIPRIVEIIKGAFEKEMGKSGKLKLPHIF